MIPPFARSSPKSALVTPILLALLGLAATASAQAFKTVVEFDGAHGGNPTYVSLAQGTDGDYYGTAAWGGNYTCHPRFDSGCGSVFKITAAGKIQYLHTFCLQEGCPEGGVPVAGLVLGMDGNFYGTTSYGGSGCTRSDGNCGTVFKITPAGVLTTLYTFCTTNGCPDGASSYASLFLAADGNFYGTTYEGGPYDAGSIFSITSSGALTTLYMFAFGDGMNPYAGVVQAPDGNFYGTAGVGGNVGTYCDTGCGSVYKMTPAGAVTFLYEFCSEYYECPDGAVPLSGLTVGNDGNLYGTTNVPFGTVFKITPQGQLTNIYLFHCSANGCFDGVYPSGTDLGDRRQFLRHD